MLICKNCDTVHRITFGVTLPDGVTIAMLCAECAARQQRRRVILVEDQRRFEVRMEWGDGTFDIVAFSQQHEKVVDIARRIALFADVPFVDRTRGEADDAV